MARQHGPSMKPSRSPDLPGGRVRLPDQVEKRLRHSILSREILPGARLPPERKLSEELGVNRSSVREAIRRLESQNLVESRQGDGTRVLDFLERGGIDLVPALLLAGADGELDRSLLEDVLEFRSFAGQLIARLAALRHGEEDRAALLHVLEQMQRATSPQGEALPGAEPPPALPRLDMELFLILGRAAGNTLLRLLVNALVEPYLAHAPLLSGLTGEPVPLVRHATILVQAVLDRQPAAAEVAAREYLEHGRRGVEQALGLERR